jgi:hypothetical protein
VTIGASFAGAVVSESLESLRGEPVHSIRSAQLFALQPDPIRSDPSVHSLLNSRSRSDAGLLVHPFDPHESVTPLSEEYRGESTVTEYMLEHR